jgi:hypothetical protein
MLGRFDGVCVTILVMQVYDVFDAALYYGFGAFVAGEECSVQLATS